MILRLLSPSPKEDIPATFHLPEGKRSISIGRTGNNQFRIDETDVSADHARIEVSDEGKYELIDQDSSNGTFVNENKIARTELHSGDVIRFANTRFSFEDSGAKKTSSDSLITEPGATRSTREDSDELESLKNALWKKDAIAADLQKALDAERSEKSRLSSELGTSRDSHELLTKELKEAKAHSDSLKADLAELRRGFDSEQSRAAQLSTDLNSSQGSNDSLKHSLSSAKATIESLNLSLSEFQNALELEQSKSHELSIEFSESQISNQTLTQDLANANAQIESLQLTQDDLRARHIELENAILEALEKAKSIQNSLNSDWLRWTGGVDSEKSATAIANASNAHYGIAAIAAILLDLISARNQMRPELDKIEAIWDKCGPDVEGVLTNICKEIKDEIARLSGVAISKEETIAELEADLLALREGIDDQLRRAQTINREGVHCEVPEKLEKMVLATNTEEAIFRKIVSRIDTINELSSHYHKKLTSRKIAKSLDVLRDDFLELLKEHSVTPFTYDKGTVLTKRDSAEVDLISPGHDQNTPTHMRGPVKVIQTLYPGIMLKAGDREIVIKKAQVKVKPA